MDKEPVKFDGLRWYEPQAKYQDLSLDPSTINMGTIRRYLGYITEELDASEPNFARISSLGRSISKLAETYMCDQTLKPGD